MAATMFERYGGFAKVSRIVSAFYDRVFESPLLVPYFENIDMKRLIDHQTKFIASLMGGPASYSNEQLERVHANLGISEEAFMEAVALLQETFEDFEFDESDIATIHRDIMSRKNFISVRK
jgi:hemoglobin